MGILGMMGFMGGMGRADGQDGRTGHKKYGQAFGDEGLPMNILYPCVYSMFYPCGEVLYALYFFFIGSQERPTPSFLKILRSTSESMTVE